MMLVPGDIIYPRHHSRFLWSRPDAQDAFIHRASDHGTESNGILVKRGDTLTVIAVGEQCKTVIVGVKRSRWHFLFCSNKQAYGWLAISVDTPEEDFVKA